MGAYMAVKSVEGPGTLDADASFVRLNSSTNDDRLRPREALGSISSYRLRIADNSATRAPGAVQPYLRNRDPSRRSLTYTATLATRHYHRV